MMPGSASSDSAALSTRRGEQSSSSKGPPNTGGDGDSPSTPEEAAKKFETVLVRQFTKVMTEDMFSGSLAGDGGGKWMESQRDRQRDWMTDMITDRLVESNSLGISEMMMQKWTTTDSGDGAEDAAPDASEIPSDTADPSRTIIDSPPRSQNDSHIDHAA